MSPVPFSLIPFVSSPAEPIATLEITGTIARQSNQLTLHYALQGDLVAVVIPAPATTPARTYALWEHTCFEFFLAERGRDRYWEFNLSPSGDWNVYQLDGYRQGLCEDRSFVSLPFTVQHHPQELSLQLDVNLEAIVPANVGLEIAITAVIELAHGDIAHGDITRGDMSYWALTHAGPEADFHRRESFAIALDAS